MSQKREEEIFRRRARNRSADGYGSRHYFKDLSFANAIDDLQTVREHEHHVLRYPKIRATPQPLVTLCADQLARPRAFLDRLSRC